MSDNRRVATQGKPAPRHCTPGKPGVPPASFFFGFLRVGTFVGTARSGSAAPSDSSPSALRIHRVVAFAAARLRFFASSCASSSSRAVVCASLGGQAQQHEPDIENVTAQLSVG